MSFRIAILLVLMTTSAAAEERCLVQETPRQCLRRLIATRAYEAAKADLAAVSTAPSAAGSPVRTAVKDFLSAASAHLDGSTLKDNGKAFTLDYNLPGTLLGARRQVNLEMTLTDPALSPAVGAEIAANPTTTTSLKQALGHGDDVAFSASFNPVTQRLGRSLDPHRALFESMLLALVSDTGAGTPSVPVASFDTPFVQILPDAAARMTAMAEFETASIAALPAVADRLTQDLTRLVNNQPQLFASGMYHYRKPVVGPREQGYRVTWEIGTDNINSFRRSGGRDCEAQGTCLAAFNDYASRTAARHRSGRLSLAIEYTVIEANNAGLTSPPATEIAGHKLTYSAVYGREIPSLLTGKPGRIDFALSFDGKKTTHTVSTSAVQPARIGPTAVVQLQLLPPSTTRRSAAVTMTQPLWGPLSIPLAVVWSDREQWLPGTGTELPPLPISPAPPPGNGHAQPFVKNDRGVEIRIGIRYQLPSFSRPPSPRPKDCCCCR